MTDPMKQAWSEVEQRLSTLGQMVKDHYRGANDGAQEADAVPGRADDAGAELKGAFERLMAAVREVGERAADVARDDDVKTQARQAAASLNDALSATVNMIGEQVGALFKRSDKGQKDSAAKVAEPNASAESAQSAATPIDPSTG